MVQNKDLGALAHAQTALIVDNLSIASNYFLLNISSSSFLSYFPECLHQSPPCWLSTHTHHKVLPPQPGSHHIVRVLGHLTQVAVRQSQSSSHCTNVILIETLQVLGDFEMV